MIKCQDRSPTVEEADIGASCYDEEKISCYYIIEHLFHLDLHESFHWLGTFRHQPCRSRDHDVTCPSAYCATC